jgi:hypothetical protein
MRPRPAGNHVRWAVPVTWRRPVSTDGTPGEATTGIATWQDPGRRSGALAWAVEHWLRTG